MANGMMYFLILFVVNCKDKVRFLCDEAGEEFFQSCMASSMRLFVV